MTITLHWWAIPVGIVLIGWVWALISDSNDSGMFSGMAAALIFLVSLVVAAAITCGHFI
jgi:hypothetical protein